MRLSRNWLTAVSKRRFSPLLLLLLGVVVLIGFALFRSASQRAEKRLGPTAATSGEQTPVATASKATVPAPEFVVEDLNGQEVRLSDFRGKNLLLVFWSIYCGWCAKEKEDLNRFTEENRGKVEVVAVVPESRQEVQEYTIRENIKFQILFDIGQRTFSQYRVPGTPDHFLINGRGEIVGRRTGYASYDALLSLRSKLTSGQ